jgi:hypothetical protein
MTSGLQRRVAVPRAQRFLDALPQRLAKLVLRLDEAALGGAFHVGDEAQRRGDAEVRLEQHLLELLERAGGDSAADDDADVGEGDVLDLFPERAFRDVTRLAKKAHRRKLAPAPGSA